METKFAPSVSGESDLPVEQLKSELAEEQARLLDLDRRLERESENRKKVEEDLRERFRFENLLFELSARFIHISHERIDSEIQNALKRIREFFRFDRCGLVKIMRDGTSWQIAYFDFKDDLPDLPVGVELPVDLFPWVFKRIVERHEVLRYASLEEMPPEASVDKRRYEKWGIRSVLNIPLTVDGSMEWVLTLASHNRERLWAEDYIPRLRMLGEMTIKSMQLGQAQRRLEEREKFERLVSEISGAFVIPAPESLENQITSFLRRIAEFFDADRCFLRMFSEDRSRLDIAFEYYKGEIEPIPDFLSTGELQWYAERLARGKPVVINTLDDLPEEAENERSYCKARKLKSVLSVPMATGPATIGVCTLASVRAERTWPQDLVQRMQFVAKVFAGALFRNGMEKQLRERLEEIQNLKKQLENENIYLRKEIKVHHLHEEIVGRGQAMKEILAKIEQVAHTDATVLIEGETGSGKELLARAVHRLSERGKRPLVTVNCASLPPSLIESELFGREKGAYTGALTRMKGRFELADGATLFLDEIGELPHEVQAKLLRVLEKGEFERLGSSTPIRVDVRIIAATNRNLSRESAEGNFRKDLYYRLNVFPIVVPPLRERPEDIPLLVWEIVKQFEKKMGKRIERIRQKDMEKMVRYPWPGNVRELKNVVEHAMILNSGKMLDLSPPQIASSPADENLTHSDAERENIIRVLRKCGWRIAGQNGAAEKLGLKRSTLQSKMKKLGIRRPSG